MRFEKKEKGNKAQREIQEWPRKLRFGQWDEGGRGKKETIQGRFVVKEGDPVPALCPLDGPSRTGDRWKRRNHRFCVKRCIGALCLRIKNQPCHTGRAFLSDSAANCGSDAVLFPFAVSRWLEARGTTRSNHSIDRALEGEVNRDANLEFPPQLRGKDPQRSMLLEHPPLLIRIGIGYIRPCGEILGSDFRECLNHRRGYRRGSLPLLAAMVPVRGAFPLLIERTEISP